jgi:hypothetical protein
MTHDHELEWVTIEARHHALLPAGYRYRLTVSADGADERLEILARDAAAIADFIERFRDPGAAQYMR